MQELKLTSETCICTEPSTTVDNAVGKHTTTKSVRTQYNPLYVLSKLETTETCENDLKVKWPTSKRGEKVVNTDLIFQPNTKAQFVSPKDSAVFSDEVSDTESDTTIDNESDHTIMRRQVKVITHLTLANNWMKVQKIIFLKNQKIFSLLVKLVVAVPLLFYLQGENKNYICKNARNSSCCYNEMP